MEWQNIELEAQKIFSGVLEKYQWHKWCDVVSETENDPLGELEPTFFRVIFPAFNKGFGCSYVKGKIEPLVWVDDFGAGYFKQPIFILWLKYDPDLTSKQRLIDLVNEWLNPAMDMKTFNERYAECA